MKDFVTQKNKEKSIRIRQIREYFCYGKNIDFANKLGIKPNHASGLCNGTVSVGAETIDKVLIAFPEVSRHWILTGEGSMLNESPSDKPSVDDLKSIECSGSEKMLRDLIAQKDIVIESLQSQIKTMQAYIDRLEKTLKDYEE